MYCGHWQKAIHAAIAIEILHNFTLVHDDIMDQAPMRRNQPTIHQKWNMNTAILSGDALLIHAYNSLSQCDHDKLPEILKVFNSTAIMICEGQQLDMNFETRKDVSIEEYIRMIRLKTAALIGGSLKIGAVLGNASKKEADKVYNIGIHLGIAFQLMDDLLDVYSYNEKFGKRIGGDIASNKKTYLYLKAHELADANTKHQLYHIFENTSMNEENKIDAVETIYKQFNIKEATINAIQKYTTACISMILSLDLYQARN
jgi:geranylgeranyl diphosphate synthase type II